MEQTIRVCTRCGEPASEHRFCPSCGLNLATMRQLPTRTEWEGWQERRLRQADEGEQSARVNHPDGAHSGQTGFGEQSYPHDLVWWRPAAEDFERPPVRQPPAGSQGRGQRAQSTNVLAVVSLAFGILWLYWLGSLIAVVTGHIARRQTETRIIWREATSSRSWASRSGGSVLECYSSSYLRQQAADRRAESLDERTRNSRLDRPA